MEKSNFKIRVTRGGYLDSIVVEQNCPGVSCARKLFPDFRGNT